MKSLLCGVLLASVAGVAQAQFPLPNQFESYSFRTGMRNVAVVNDDMLIEVDEFHFFSLPGLRVALEIWNSATSRWDRVDTSDVLPLGYGMGTFDDVIVHRTQKRYLRLRVIDSNDATVGTPDEFNTESLINGL